MKDELPAELLEQLSRMIASSTALHFPRERWSDLKRRLEPAAKEFGFHEQKDFLEWLISAPLSSGQIEILASHLTIPETYFWREPLVFNALEQHILPELIRERQNKDRRLRIWSAGCATGEEPYSLAMALHRALPSRKGWQISILATDLNPRILRLAKAGVYKPWSFRNAPAWLQRDYFLPKAGGKFELRPEIRKMVSFAYLNLGEDVYPSALNSTTGMDIIFCRNVLMYFMPERARQVIQSLVRCLSDGGWLMVGACELLREKFDRLSCVQFSGTTVYRKQDISAPALPSLEPAADIFPQAPSVASRQSAPPMRRPAPAARRARRTARPAVAPLGSRRAASVQASPLRKPTVQVAMDSGPHGHKALDTRILTVRNLANQGQYTQALALCEQAMAANKLDPELHYLLATIFQEQNLDSEAIAALRRALYLEPNLVVAHYSLGNLMLRQGNPRAAQKSFANVLELLDACPQEEVLPEAEGLTVGRLREIVEATIQAGGLA